MHFKKCQCHVVRKQYYNSATGMCGIKAFVLWNYNAVSDVCSTDLNIYAHTVSITQARISESRPGLKCKDNANASKCSASMYYLSL